MFALIFVLRACGATIAKDGFELPFLDEHLADVPVMWLPECILELISFQEWSTILILHSPSHSTAKRTHQVCLSWLRNALQWPSDIDVQQMVQHTGRFAQKAAVPLDEHGVMFLLDVLRQTKNSLLDELEEHEAEHMYLQMERAAEGLHFLAASFESTSGLSKNAGKSGELLVNAVRIARHVRNRSNLQSLQELMVDAFMPTPLRDLAKSVMDRAPAGASISRHQVGESKNEHEHHVPRGWDCLGAQNGKPLRLTTSICRSGDSGRCSLIVLP